MTITLETELVRQCAPTLAGLKAASLFRFVFHPEDSPFAQITEIRRSLEPKEIRLEVLSYDCIRQSALLYVYRPPPAQHPSPGSGKQILPETPGLRWYHLSGDPGPDGPAPGTAGPLPP